MWPGERWSSLTTDYLWISYGFWTMPYARSSYSAVSSNIPKYEVSCQAWQLLIAFSVVWSYQTTSPMSQNFVRLLKCWSKRLRLRLSGFPHCFILYHTTLDGRNSGWSKDVRCIQAEVGISTLYFDITTSASQSENPRGEELTPGRYSSVDKNTAPCATTNVIFFYNCQVT